jgi:methionine-S-sulfoxide reductase
MGCFWGAEKKFWNLAGVLASAVGYQGGTVPNPDYQMVCTGATGHAEVVSITYDSKQISLWELLTIFWENHDPTQGNRQGNDVGTQYRSAIFWSDASQVADIMTSQILFAAQVKNAGLGPITTQIASAAEHHFWPAEEYHQKYLLKNPNGYDCHAHTGLYLPRHAPDAN